MGKPEKNMPTNNDQIAQLGAAIDAKLAAMTAQIDTVAARVDVQASAIAAVNQRIDQLPVVAPPPPVVIVPPVVVIPPPVPDPPPVIVVIPPPALPPAVPDPPLFEQWKKDIQAAADIHCAYITRPDLGGVEGLGMCYYDGAWIWRNMAAYFNRPDYLPARDAAVKFYRDWYSNVQPTHGGVSGIDVFPHGMYWHWKDTGDELSKQAVIDIAQHAAFASWGEIVNYLPPLNSSREAAYALHAKLLARELGAEVWAIEELRGICLGHLRMWREILDGTNATPSDLTDGSLQDVRAFMVGLTCHALISYVTYTPDPVVVDAIKATLDLLWEKQYDSATQSFCYDDRVIPSVGDRSPAPDLNMLIAPAYAWLGMREKADLLFEGSVKGAWIAGGKQFNQSLRWTFDYLNWRNTRA